MKARPYVGITGPANSQETIDICREFSEAGYSMNSPHIPMLGFLVSYKTLNGQAIKNKRYPPVNTLSKLLEATDGKVLTMVHYNSREIDSLSNQISHVFEGIYENNLCRALQLNIVSPDISQVQKIKETHPEMLIVFQASNKFMKGKSPEEISKEIKEYGDSINYVLIDPSGGRGIPFNLESSITIYSELKEKCPDLTGGFAGGFTGKNVSSRLNKIITQTKEKDFCIDTEGGMRDKLSEDYGDDIQNIHKIRDYLQDSSKVLR